MRSEMGTVGLLMRAESDWATYFLKLNHDAVFRSEVKENDKKEARHVLAPDATRQFGIIYIVA